MSDTKEKTIYDLNIHESIIVKQGNSLNYTDALKVPGGWIYRTVTHDSKRNVSHVSSVFVPRIKEGD